MAGQRLAVAGGVGQLGCSVWLQLCVCAGVCALTGAWLRGGVGCVMGSHIFSSNVPQAGREHRSGGRPDAPQASARRGRDKPAPLKENPVLLLQKRHSCFSAHWLGITHPSWQAQQDWAPPLTSSLLGRKTVRPPLPLCIFPSLLENGAVKRLSTIS